MSTYDLSSSDQLRGFFKQMNHWMLAMWRLGLGKLINAWPTVFGRIMVLIHRGRKTGLIRRTPVNYAIVNGEIYCVAGFGRKSDWLRNIEANPQVEVWLPNGWWSGEALDATDREDCLALMRQVILASGLVAHAFGLNVNELSDDDLRQIVQSYRLIHIQRRAPRTGPGGPGELSWLWPLATLLLLPLALRKRRKK